MKKGFTLIELLISIMVIVMVLTTAIVMEVKYLRAATVTKDKIQATNLAQQALNLTRTIRDNNLLNGSTPVFDGITSGRRCLVKDSNTNRWSLKEFLSADCIDTPDNPNVYKTIKLNNVEYTVEIIVQ